MNKLKLLIVSISLILASGLVSAASISANATLQSDYTWRGMTQNNEDPSVNGGIDIEFDSGFYVGTWTASVQTGSEVDYYGGYAGSLGDIGFDIGYVKFDYPTQVGSDFEELYLGVELPFGLGVTFASGEKAEDETKTEGFGISDNIEVSYGFDLGEGSVGLAYGEYDDFGDYLYLTYGFDFMDFAITVGYVDFSDDSTGMVGSYDKDSDTVFIDIGIL